MVYDAGRLGCALLPNRDPESSAENAKLMHITSFAGSMSFFSSKTLRIRSFDRKSRRKEMRWRWRQVSEQVVLRIDRHNSLLAIEQGQ